MSTRTLYQQQKYGAVELKLVYQRNMLMAMAIAFTVQAGLVLTLGKLGGEIPHMVTPDRFVGVELGGPHEWVAPSIPQPAPTGSSGVRKAAQHAIPVPVAEDRVSELPVEEPGYSPGPIGTGEGDGGVEGLGTETRSIVVPDPDPPKPWVYVEKEPVVVKSVKPVYPALALKSGLEGKVIVKMWVGKDGRVRKVEVVKSDFEILSEAAVEAARQFVFTPAYVTGGPVEVWVAVPFDFRLASAR
jgi:periplasmic protein TonB